MWTGQIIVKKKGNQTHMEIKREGRHKLEVQVTQTGCGK